MEHLIITAIIAYFVGSIPFGLILTRLAGHGDIRAIGSGNIGATNVLRTGNKWLALATLALDFGKGFAAVALLPENHITVLFVVLGHMFSIWLRFKGGKGVACLFGVAFTLSPIIGGWMAMCWLTVFTLYRYSSLGAILGIPAGIMIAMRNEAITYEPYMLALPVLLMILKHHDNIRRLLKSEEHKFSFSSKRDKG